MKKNVKILGATAAALLAVAPVVASATTANAALNFNQTTTTSPVEGALNFNLTATGNASSTASDVVRSLTAGTDQGDLKYDSANVNMNGSGTNMSADQKMSVGNTYRIVLNNVKVNSLVATRTYNIAGGYLVANNGAANSTRVYSATGTQLASGNYTFVSDPFYVTTNDQNDPNADQAPYFVLTNRPADDPGSPIPTGTTAKWNGALDLTNNKANVQDIINKALGQGGETSPVTLRNGVLSTTEQQIRDQIAAKATISSDGSFYMPKSGLDITLSARSSFNNKHTTSVVLHFYNSNVTSEYPVIYQNNQKVAQTNGSGFVPQNPIIFKAGSQSTFNPISDGNITASVNGNDQSKLDLSSLSTVSSNVNPSVPGLYSVTVRATNPAGLSTDYTYQVVVTNADTNAPHTVTVHYVPGYGVNVWAVYQGGARAFTGQRVQDGERLTAYGTANVNGVSYTQIAPYSATPATTPTANTWIPTEFLSAHNSSNTNTNKPSTNNNGEKAISGTARVTFNGKGSVKLLNANGRHVDQYVKKGSTWKVWAEKTVNGIHMYRIGNQNQWVPADYVTLN